MKLISHIYDPVRQDRTGQGWVAVNTSDWQADDSICDLDLIIYIFGEMRGRREVMIPLVSTLQSCHLARSWSTLLRGEILNRSTLKLFLNWNSFPEASWTKNLYLNNQVMSSRLSYFGECTCHDDNDHWSLSHLCEAHKSASDMLQFCQCMCRAMSMSASAARCQVELTRS